MILIAIDRMETYSVQRFTAYQVPRWYVPHNMDLRVYPVRKVLIAALLACIILMEENGSWSSGMKFVNESFAR